MVTGVEIAGLVLATLPLIITVVQEREVGIRPIDALIFTTSGRIKVSQILSDQRLRFRFFCERLLCEVGVENVADYLSVNENTRTIWAHPKLRERFLERLGESYENFDRKMKEVDERVTRIQKYTKKNVLLFSLKSLANSRDVIQLQECISTLREFAIDLPYLQHRQDKVPGKIDLLNSRSRDLHKRIQNSWACECKERHALYVKLSSKADEDFLSLLFVSDSECTKPIPECHSWSWQPTLFSGGETDSTENGLKSSKNLCKTLANIANENRTIRQHLLSLDLNGPPRQLYTDNNQPSNPSLITLEQELARRYGETRSYASGYLGVRDCVNLGVLLLTAVLRYHWTPWLPSVLRSENVYFILQGENLSRLALDEPLLRSEFQHCFITAKKDIPSTVLFEVGIMLLEIVHGNSFNCLMTEKEKSGVADGDLEDRLMWRTRAAWRLFKTLPAYMCLRSYKEATKRCLLNQFSENGEKEMLDKNIRAAIYSKAVKPLLEDVSRVI